MSISTRFLAAIKIAGWHFALSLGLALISATIVLGVWYPSPYDELSGGRGLFLLIIGVDVICGPLMTLILFNPKKSRREIGLDLSIVAALQLAALAYGAWTAWQARPVYLAFEKDRFKVLMAADLDKNELKQLPPELAPFSFGGVRTVALRPPKSTEERNKILFESIETGRDYAERPDFYIPYTGAAAAESFDRGKSLEEFFQRYPDQKVVASKVAETKSANLGDWRYLPVVGREDWVALLDKNGMIQGFLKGDGF